MYTLLLASWALALSAVAQQEVTGSDDCSCGYYDSETRQLYTESIVVYFNETEALPSEFIAQEYAHKKEKGWTTIYRKAASPDNVMLGNVSQPTWLESVENPNSLELYCDPSTPQHLVTGGSFASVRQDIEYGSFRASMRSPHPYAGGSALSMMLQYNDTDSIEIDLLNTDQSSTGRVMTLINNEYPDLNLGLNYSLIESGTPNVPAVSPWDYMDVRFDWTKDYINFTVNQNMTRSIRANHSDSSIPRLGMPLLFKHWSTGDKDYTEGPPLNRSAANVAWVRAFFNSSTMSTEQHHEFDARCQPSVACSMNDMTIRKSSAYNVTDTLKWKPAPEKVELVYRSAIVAGVFGFFGAFVLLHAILSRWVPWHLLSYRYWTGQSRHAKTEAASQEKEQGTTEKNHSSNHSQSTLVDSGASSTRTVQASSSKHALEKGSPASSDGWEKQSSSGKGGVDINVTPISGADTPNSSEAFSRSPSELSLDKDKSVLGDSQPHNQSRHLHAPFLSGLLHGHDDGTVATLSNYHSRNVRADEKGTRRDPVRMISMIPPQGPHPPTQVKAPQNAKIDYLAGAVAFSCIGVTLVHFTLTFVPGVSEGGPVMHSSSDYWSSKTVAPYLLTQIWIGPFFTTSCRFLSSRYLKGGKLSEIGNKVLLRAPRLLVPCMMVAMVEYFVVELGLTGAAQYLPSISWSTWPYVSAYPNFGGFINAMLDLAYLIPNAAPAVVPHYCTGVLWTIPVQLQFSYTTLLGTVMAREIKTPWKRFTFYILVIINYWYAFSWGALFWVGLMLSDLSITYDYKAYIHARPWIHYPLLTLMWGLAALSASAFMFSVDFGYDFLTAERNIHPDWETGLPMGDTPRGGYPNYFEPRFNTLLFATSIQIILELSTCVQKFLAWRPWQWIFPHIMTIYIMHGLVFWTFGAWLCVTLSVAGVPYWANMLLVVVLSYMLLAVVCCIATPLTAVTERNACKNLWRWAQEEPVPKRPTLGSYSKSLILNRSGASEGEGTA